MTAAVSAPYLTAPGCCCAKTRHRSRSASSMRGGCPGGRGPFIAGMWGLVLCSRLFALGVLDRENPVMAEIKREVAQQTLNQGRAIAVQERNNADGALLRHAVGKRLRLGDRKSVV